MRSSRFDEGRPLEGFSICSVEKKFCAVAVDFYLLISGSML
jgi:hypothetical protein